MRRVGRLGGRLTGGNDDESSGGGLLGGGRFGRERSGGDQNDIGNSAAGSSRGGAAVGGRRGRGGIAGMVGTGIGMIQETSRKKSDSQLSASRKGSIDNQYDRRASHENPRRKAGEKSGFGDDAPPEYDDLDWQLDDAAQEERDVDEEELGPDGQENPPSYSESQSKKSVAAQIDALACRRSPQVTSRLAAPVVLPERRPGHRTRGFVRAYSPALFPCGIDQTMWMEFLDVFDLAVKVSCCCAST